MNGNLSTYTKEKEMSSNPIIPDDSVFMTDLFHKYFGLWMKTACAVCHDRNFAEDMVLEAFAVLVPKLPLLRSLDAPAVIAFVKTTIRFTARKQMAKQASFWKRHEMLKGLYEDGSAPSPEETVETKDSFRTLLSCLSERDRDFIFLRYYVGFTVKEIAKISGLKENTVAVYLYRAREQLRTVLREGEDNG